MPRIVVGIVLIVLTCGGFILAGCHALSGPGEVQADRIPPGDYPNVVGLEGLHRFLRMSEPIIQGHEDRPMQVSVPIRFVRGGEQYAQYRFIFLDEDGAELANQMGWRAVRLPQGSEIQLQGTATSRDARDWRLEVRPSR